VVLLMPDGQFKLNIDAATVAMVRNTLLAVCLCAIRKQKPDEIRDTGR
jgi:hypothetical protein